jgi:hypothetical protein
MVLLGCSSSGPTARSPTIPDAGISYGVSFGDGGLSALDAGGVSAPDAEPYRDDPGSADAAIKDTGPLRETNGDTAPTDSAATVSRDSSPDVVPLADSARRGDAGDLARRGDVGDLATHDDLVVVPDVPIPKPDATSPDLSTQPRPDALPPSGICASEPLRTTGTVHYVCDCQTGASSNCVPGNDSNAGTSSAPWQSFSKAAGTFAKMPAGDTVALCRGGLWIANGGGFANANCQRDNTCDFRDYSPPWGDGSEPLPSIWIDGGSNGRTLMTFSHVSEHQEGFRVFNLDLHGTLTDTAIFFWNETTDVDLCNLSMDGFNISVNMSGGDQPDFGTPANIVLRSSHITNNSNIGYIAVCDNCAIEDSYFDNNGVRNATTHSVYFASQEWTVNGTNVVHETTGMRFSRNQIHHSTVQCKGAPLVVHGRHKNVVIENNTVDAVSSTDACWGPGVGCGAYAYGCWFRNTVIRGNTIKGLGNTGSENDNCTGCLIENNLVVIDKSGNGITLGGEKPRASGDSGYSRSDGQLDDPTNNTVVRNNTIYFTETATSGKGISVSSGTGHTLENNAIYFVATKAGTSDNLCYGLPSSPASAMISVDYNICEIPSNAHWASAPGSSAMTLAAWQALSGLDNHSKLTDPMFSNPPTDFTPAAGSPLLNAGDPANSPSTDLNGKLRDSQPDIGAIER